MEARNTYFWASQNGLPFLMKSLATVKYDRVLPCRSAWHQIYGIRFTAAISAR